MHGGVLQRSRKARGRVKLFELRRPKHRREAAQNLIKVEASIRGDTDCTEGVSIWLTNSG